MTDGKYTPLTDNMDDLPRTLRRAREAQQREQLAANPPPRDRMPTANQPGYSPIEPVNPYDTSYAPGLSEGPADVIVKRLKVPFLSLMGFFIKAVFAAIPALLILIAMFYGFGMLLQSYFPELIKMKIVISFPN